MVLLLSEGQTKTQACASLRISPRTISRWIEADREFAARYRTARIEQAHSLADEALRIANEPTGDMAAVQRNRLRIDTIKWLTSKIAPRLYGDRIYAETHVTNAVILLPALGSAPTGLTRVESNRPFIEGDGMSRLRARDPSED